MRERQMQGTDGLPTRERMATLGAAAKDAMGLKGEGRHETEHGANYIVPAAQVESIIADWPDAPQKVARQMLDKNGPPNEATQTKLFWYRRGPYKRIELTSDELLHNFPAPHADFLTHWIDYRVPPEKFDELGRYDGSCLVDRTAGEVGARCDSEAANVVTLNLMHEIVTGKRTVDDARKVYADSVMGYTMGRSAPYAERLLFQVADGGTEDPDEDMGMGPMARQAAGKIKDVVSGGDSGTH